MKLSAGLRRIIVVGLTTTVVLGTAACASTSNETDTSPIKIGVPIGLTGPAATQGGWARLGIDAAVDEINKNGGIDGRQVETVYVDTELDPTKAVTAVTRLINQDEVDVIVGPLTTDESLASLPQMTQADVANINASGSAITPEAAPYGFAMLPNAHDQAAKQVDVAIEELGADKIAGLNYNRTQGKVAAVGWAEQLAAHGLKATGVQEYDFPATDLTPQLLSLKAGDPEALLVFNSTGIDTGRLVTSLRDLNWDVPVIGGFATTYADETKSVAGPDAYANLTSVTWPAFSACDASEVRPEVTDFIDTLDAAYAESDLENISYDYPAVFHDSIYLLKAAIEATGSTSGAAIAEWMENEGAEAAKDLPLVHTGFAMSPTNHFLFDSKSLVWVNPGETVAPHVFQRLACG